MKFLQVFFGWLGVLNWYMNLGECSGLYCRFASVYMFCLIIDRFGLWFSRLGLCSVGLAFVQQAWPLFSRFGLLDA